MEIGNGRGTRATSITDFCLMGLYSCYLSTFETTDYMRQRCSKRHWVAAVGASLALALLFLRMGGTPTHSFAERPYPFGIEIELPMRNAADWETSLFEGDTFFTRTLAMHGQKAPLLTDIPRPDIPDVLCPPQYWSGSKHAATEVGSWRLALEDDPHHLVELASPVMRTWEVCPGAALDISGRHRGGPIVVCGGRHTEGLSTVCVCYQDAATIRDIVTDLVAPNCTLKH